VAANKRDGARPREKPQQIADELRAEIVSGKLSEGDSLGHEPDLVERFGVSRPSYWSLTYSVDVDGKSRLQNPNAVKCTPSLPSTRTVYAPGAGSAIRGCGPPVEGICVGPGEIPGVIEAVGEVEGLTLPVARGVDVTPGDEVGAPNAPPCSGFGGPAVVNAP